jgi:hypothetical protein
MGEELIEVEIVKARDFFAAMSADSPDLGDLLTCDRCKDSRELICAVLVVSSCGEFWTLCENCLRQMPKLGDVG